MRVAEAHSAWQLWAARTPPPQTDGCGSTPIGSHFGVGPILEPMLVGIGMFTGGKPGFWPMAIFPLPGFSAFRILDPEMSFGDQLRALMATSSWGRGRCHAGNPEALPGSAGDQGNIESGMHPSPAIKSIPVGGVQRDQHDKGPLIGAPLNQLSALL